MMEFLIENSGKISLAGFFGGFLFVFVSVMRPSKKAEIESHALIPLKEKD